MTHSPIRRTMAQAKLNAISNHPEVRPWLGGSGVVDWGPFVADPANVALECEGGGWVFLNMGDGRYEVHSQLHPEARGDWEAARAALRFMFTATDCIEVVSKVPDGNLAAKGIARTMGFREAFRREDAWRAPDGQIVGVSYVALGIERWRSMDPTLVEEGEWWHSRLEAAKVACGSTLPIHPHDEAHERAVGASVLMFKAGNPRKGVRQYNAWARFAGYAPVLLLSESPVVVDAQDAIVSLSGGELEVLLCRGAPSERQSQG